MTKEWKIKGETQEERVQAVNNYTKEYFCVIANGSGIDHKIYGYSKKEAAQQICNSMNTPTTPLPDDEEIMEYTETALAEATLEYETGFISGAKWMREKCSSLLKAQEQRHINCKHLEKRDIFENCQCTECGQLFIK